MPAGNIMRLVAMLALLAASQAHAALFWQKGVHSNVIEVCFVGNSLTQNPVLANRAREYMREFEWYSGIRFTWINNSVCPPAVPHPQDPSRDYYAGTIRIILFGVTSVNPFGWVPGTGCPPDPFWQNPDGSYNGDNDGWGSWANPPNELELRRSCIYNLKLGPDADNQGVPWRNHTLHEVGHAVGLGHEHERIDVDPTCTAVGFGGGEPASGNMTPYDRNSVMNYQFLSCGINGNYGHSGLSAWDRLAIHILYPEPNPIAELRGNLVVRAGTPLNLLSAWQSRGALIFNVASNFQWRINGGLVGSNPALSWTTNTPGTYNLQYSYNDSLVTVPARNYVFNTTLRVLSATDYERFMGAISNSVLQMASTGLDDADADGVLDLVDNCLNVANSSQLDTDNDNIGNACDPDIAIPNNCIVNFLDLNVLKAALFASPGSPNWNPNADFNGDLVVNFLDLLIMKHKFFGPPGPSASGCN